MTIWSKSLFVIGIILLTNVCPQGHSTHGHGNPDPRHSIYGPARPTVWEFQFGIWSRGNEVTTAFDFYRKNQRNKTFFMRYMNNGLDMRNVLPVKQLTGGIVLFPYKDDDRFRMEFGGTIDKIIDTSLANKALFSRMTFKPTKLFWFRAGYESVSEYEKKHSAPYIMTDKNTAYLAGKIENTRFTLTVLTGTGKKDDNSSIGYGGAGLIKGPFNTFVLGGYIKSDNTLENVRTLAIGKWAPFRPDGRPSGFAIWKHKDNYDFQLGAVLWGKTNLLVRPAVLGMTQGIFISSIALRENSLLRQGQLMTITDDYRNADNSLFYIYLNNGMEIIPGSINNVGIKALRFYKILDKKLFSIISNPVVGIFYDEETIPDYNPMTSSFIDETSSYLAFQLGVTISDKYIVNVISYPSKSEWNIAYSYIHK
ncbi:MAG: hypothetical protein ACE5D0_04230 [Fidelibacterota bacterium]